MHYYLPMDVMRVLVTAAALVVVIAGITAAKAILVPFFFAVFVAVIAGGAYMRFRNIGLPAWISVSAVIVIAIGFFFSLFILVFSSIDQFRTVLPEYGERYLEIRENFFLQLQDWGFEVEPETTQEIFNFDAAMQFFLSSLQSFGSILGYVVLVLGMVFFIFLEVTVFPGKVRAAFGDSDDVLSFIGKINRAIEQYFFIKTISNALTGIIVAFVMWSLGLEFAFFWGMMTFLLNYIPYFGAILSAIPAILIGLLSGGWVPAIGMGLTFFVTSLFFGNFFEPKLLGHSVNLSILFIFLAMLFWSWILGPVGMIFAVPLTAALKIILEMNDSTRWMGILLAAGAPRRE